MAGIILARAVLEHVSGLPADADVNDFVFSSLLDADDLADWLDSAAIVQQFYNYEVTPGSGGVASFLSAVIDRTSSTSHVDYYDLTTHLDGSPTGPPIKQAFFDLLDALGDEVVPAEAAAVVTLYGEGRSLAPVREVNPTPPPAYIRPKQSLTGRLYVGPLNSDAFGLVDGEVRITSAFQTALAASAAHVVDRMSLAPELTVWGVWSRKNASLAGIDSGAVDNAPDVQRRRGVAKSNRLLWP